MPFLQCLEQGRRLLCGALISLDIIEENREEEREIRRRSIPSSKFDLFLKRWGNSRFLPIRILYKIVYYTGIGFIAIASFFAC